MPRPFKGICPFCGERTIKRKPLPAKIGKKTLDVLRAYIETDGAASLRTIAARSGLSSASTAAFHIRKLEKLGLLEREPKDTK